MKNKSNKIMTMLMMMLMLFPMNVLAAEEVTEKINKLNELVLGIITAAGVIVLAWGVFEFATGYQSGDTTQQTMSLKKVISGILMVAAPTIVNLLM